MHLPELVKQLVEGGRKINIVRHAAGDIAPTGPFFVLSAEERTQRMNIRNYLLVATREELEREIELLEGKKPFHEACIRELIAELE